MESKQKRRHRRNHVGARARAIHAALDEHAARLDIPLTRLMRQIEAEWVVANGSMEGVAANRGVPLAQVQREIYQEWLDAN